MAGNPILALSWCDSSIKLKIDKSTWNICKELKVYGEKKTLPLLTNQIKMEEK